MTRNKNEFYNPIMQYAKASRSKQTFWQSLTPKEKREEIYACVAFAVLIIGLPFFFAMLEGLRY